MPDYSLPPDESDLPQGGQGATVSLRALHLITAGLKRHRQGLGEGAGLQTLRCDQVEAAGPDDYALPL